MVASPEVVVVSIGVVKLGFPPPPPPHLLLPPPPPRSGSSVVPFDGHPPVLVEISVVVGVVVSGG